MHTASLVSLVGVVAERMAEVSICVFSKRSRLHVKFVEVDGVHHVSR